MKYLNFCFSAYKLLCTLITLKNFFLLSERSVLFNKKVWSRLSIRFDFLQSDFRILFYLFIITSGWFLVWFVGSISRLHMAINL